MYIMYVEITRNVVRESPVRCILIRVTTSKELPKKLQIKKSMYVCMYIFQKKSLQHWCGLAFSLLYYTTTLLQYYSKESINSWKIHIQSAQ